MAATITSIPAAAPTRPRTVLVGTGFAIAASLMLFACLFGIYLHERAAVRAVPDQTWLPESARLELAPPTMIAWTLMLSCAFIQWAAYALKRNDRGHAYMALALTLVFGFMAIVQTTFQYRQMGLAIDQTKAAVLIYTISGTHLAMLGAAMLFVLFAAFRALAGQFTGGQTDGVVAASLYWYTVVFIYFVMWIGIYIAK